MSYFFKEWVLLIVRGDAMLDRFGRIVVAVLALLGLAALQQSLTVWLVLTDVHPVGTVVWQTDIPLTLGAWFVSIPAAIYLLVTLGMALERACGHKLQIIFDNKYVDCDMKAEEASDPSGKVVPHHYFRVGVMNRSNKSIDNVSVIVASLKPNVLKYASIRLGVEHSRADGEGNYAEYFPVHPSKEPRCFVDVVHKPGTGEWKDTMFLGAATRQLVVRLKAGRYELALVATGQNVREESRSFIIDVSERGELLFEPVKESRLNLFKR